MPMSELPRPRHSRRSRRSKAWGVCAILSVAALRQAFLALSILPPFSRPGVSRAVLRDALEISSWERLSINWLGGAREVGGGFTASLGHGTILYRYAIDNVVQQLGLLVPSHDSSISCPETVKRVGRFVKADLVDWYRLARIASSDTLGFSRWWDTYGFYGGIK